MGPGNNRCCCHLCLTYSSHSPSQTRLTHHRKRVDGFPLQLSSWMALVNKPSELETLECYGLHKLLTDYMWWQKVLLQIVAIYEVEPLQVPASQTMALWTLFVWQIVIGFKSLGWIKVGWRFQCGLQRLCGLRTQHNFNFEKKLKMHPYSSCGAIQVSVSCSIQN